jgi:hypothetical protein
MKTRIIIVAIIVLVVAVGALSQHRTFLPMVVRSDPTWTPVPLPPRTWPPDPLTPTSTP